MSAEVKVKDINGIDLGITKRCGHVRYLLKTGKARVVCNKPFTIQLKYLTGNLRGGKIIAAIDVGRTNIGFSVVAEDGTAMIEGELKTRNKEIPKNMLERKMHRQASRRGERLRRQRKARANGTVFKETEIRERYLPHYEKPIQCKYIKNTEAKYCNRKRPEGWLTPTARQCVQTHINLLKKLFKYYNITDIVLEVNKFDFQAMENPIIKRWEYQRGKLYGYNNIKEFISETQEGKCLLCGKADIEHYHHIKPKHEVGANTYENIAGLCKNCHKKVHTEEKAKQKLSSKKQGIIKKYGGTSIINIAMPYIIEEVAKLIGEEHLHFTTGKATKDYREERGIEKSHANDSYCIACTIIENPVTQLALGIQRAIQYRRHDRGLIHKQNCNRVYYLDGKLVAVNRHKAIEQKQDSLEEYRKSLGLNAEQVISRLKVKEHKPIYKDINRVMPGAKVECGGKIFTLQKTDGKHKGIPDYYVAAEDGCKYRYKECKVIKKNEGIVFLEV